MKTQNAIAIHITANTRQERQNWAHHFELLFVGANRGIVAGLWEGVAEPDLTVRHWDFGTPSDFATLVEKVWKDARAYQVACNQMAVLIEVTVAGITTAYLLEGEDDWQPALVDVILRIAKVNQAELDALMEKWAERQGG